jgi:hypothetical protein
MGIIGFGFRPVGRQTGSYPASTAGSPEKFGNVSFVDSTKRALVNARTSADTRYAPNQSVSYVELVDTVRVAVRMSKDRRNAG